MIGERATRVSWYLGDQNTLNEKGKDEQGGTGK